MADYAAVFKAQEHSGHVIPVNRVLFGAASDAAAKTVANALAAICAGQLVAVSKYVSGPTRSDTYPAGTKYTLQGHLFGPGINPVVDRFRLRNVDSAKTAADWDPILTAAGIHLPSYDVQVDHTSLAIVYRKRV